MGSLPEGAGFVTAPLLLSVFPTFAVGGAQIRFTTLANHLGSEWRHAIVAMDGVTSARERLDPGLAVTFPEIDVRKRDTAGNVRRFRAALRALGPRTLLTHNFGSIEWAMANRLAVTRHVHVEDGFGPEERDRQIGRRVWLRRLFLRGRTVALPSQALMRIAREVWRLDPARLHYVPNGVDLARFAGPRGASSFPGEGPIVGTVAALRPEKNIARLIRAFAVACRVAPARLVVVGDGAERGRLEQLAEEFGVGGRVHFLGHLSDPSRAIKSFDVFAMSSDTEQMPISLLEAMAAGLPVTATAVGDIAAMLPPGQGAFVTAREDTALAGTLARLIADSGLRARLGAENRARAEEAFDEGKMFASWASLIT